MAEFTEYLQRLRPCQSLTGIGMNMHMLQHQLPELNPGTSLENFSVSDFSLGSFLVHHPQQPEFPVSNYAQNNNTSGNNLSTSNFHPDILNSTSGSTVLTVSSNQDAFFPDSKKRKAESPSPTSSKNASPCISTVTNTKPKNSGRGKKGKNKEKEPEKAEDVIHVRAKRGQATDSHSIAERVRREKINNKLRCLQDLVPGCHKSMGMAVMLEEIINYVHSLQNQVEFLSMELAAASSYSYDLNMETESSKKSQVANSLRAQETEKWVREGYGELSCYQSTWSI